MLIDIKNMVIDCFPFFNELDVLEIRLNVLNDVVDKFVIVEASKTQSKIDKPFYFEENKHRYSKFLDKIIHIKIEEYPEENGWAMENFQRNCIQRGIEKLNLTINDIIAISDVDEIWNPAIIKDLDDLLDQHKFLSVDMNYFVFYLNLITVDKKWIGTIFSKFKNLHGYSPQDLRNIKDHVIYIKNSGWHLGYQGGKEIVYQKYLSCIEPLNKNLLPTKEKFFEEFDNKIKDGGSFIFSDDLQNNSIKLKKIDIKNYLPEYIIKNKEIYKYLLYGIQ
jgi:beta-1,4-mannosyl-glycoprotein beta-1,4-N-acetylglucosaminyltransferase